MYNCIYILLFLGFEDTSFANFTSASHIFYDLRMLLIEILHPQPTLSRPCGYSTVKMCILNPRKSIIADISPQYPLSCYLLHNLSQYITYKKIDIRNSSEYGVSVGDTQSVDFCGNEFERTCSKLRSSKFEFKFICFQQKSTLLCVSHSWNLSKNSYINFL